MLLGETDAAMARQTLLQAASLPDHLAANAGNTLNMRVDPTGPAHATAHALLRSQLITRIRDEGQVSRAECTCPTFRKQGLKGGPCVHLVALRLAHADQERKRLRGIDPRQALAVETRAYSRRDPGGEEVYQVSLERQRLKVRWGRAGQPLRLLQNILRHPFRLTRDKPAVLSSFSSTNDPCHHGLSRRARAAWGHPR